MKKILLFVITLFICSKVYALDIELRVINPNGVEIKEETETLLIPYQSTVKLLDDSEGKTDALVQYNDKTISIKKTDLNPVQDTFDSSFGYKLDNEETIKIFDTNGLVMYKGPSKEFYDSLNKVIPSGVELTYGYVDDKENTTDKYAYVTYEGISGWVFIDLTNEKCATKENGKIMVINSSNIELKDDIKGKKIESTIKSGDIIDYNYVTKYQYNITHDNKSLWLSITGEDAIATTSTIESISLNVGDKVYEKPNSTVTIYEVKEPAIVNPLFHYNGVYYIEIDNVKGWVKSDNVIGSETSSKVDLTEKEVSTPEPIVETQKESNKKVPTTVELIIIIGLGVILLLSLTSLIAVVIMNKKNGNILQKNIEESNNNETNGE